MTGGLAYVFRTSLRGDRNHSSVRFATLQQNEEVWLRRILRRHVQLTGSPRAARLLRSATLPVVRVEPLHPPCTVEETWESILARLTTKEARTFEPENAISSDGSIVM